MRFHSHQCWFPRDAKKPLDYEDASTRSDKWGRAVIADGVSSAIFSRIWAQLLTRTAVLNPPTFDSNEDVAEWLKPLQLSWQDEIRQAKITVPLWAVMPKISSVGGQATFLGIQLESILENDVLVTDRYRLLAHAIGDSVLYVVRDSERILSFPITESKTFEEPPWAFSSLVKNVKYKDHIHRLATECRVGDLLVLCTDAIGKWSMQEYEEGRQVDWMRYWENDTAWHQDICRLRTKQSSEPGPRLVVDDCTLLLLEVVAETPVENEPDTACDRSDEPFILLAKELSRETSSHPYVTETDSAHLEAVGGMPCTEALPHSATSICERDESPQPATPSVAHTDSGTQSEPPPKLAESNEPALETPTTSTGTMDSTAGARALPASDARIMPRQSRGGFRAALNFLLGREASQAKEFDDNSSHAPPPHG